jgi:8-oxo-dGTP diphosphatase
MAEPERLDEARKGQEEPGTLPGGHTVSVAEGRKTLLIDGNNVMGATADGWWRDPPAAVRRLLDRIRCFAKHTGMTVEVVLDTPQPDLPEGVHDGVVVRYATRRGRDAADDRIIEILDAGEARLTEVVTSDRELADRALLRGAHVTGAGTFLTRLAAMGC